MFGFGDTSYEDVEDVIVEDADDVVLKDPEDVFVQHRAVSGTIEIVDVGDVYVDEPAEDYATPSRDCVLDGGDDVTVTHCEDVLVRPASIDGDLRIERTADDVYIKQADGVVVEDSEDVFFRGGVTSTDDVTVGSSEDVWFERDAVGTDVTAEDTEDILQQSAGSVTQGVLEQSPQRPAPVHLVDVEDVRVAGRGIGGRLVVAHPGDVLEDANF